MWKVHVVYDAFGASITVIWFANFRESNLTPYRQRSKTLILSTNVDQKSLETEFSVAICHPNGDRWQSKTLFLAISDPRSSIVKRVFDCRYPMRI